MVRDIEPAKRKYVFIFRPLTLDQFGIQPLLLEKSVFDRGKNGRLTSNADIADPDFDKGAASRLRICETIGSIPDEQQGADGRSSGEFERSHRALFVNQNQKEKTKNNNKIVI
jgi:hypothetical protein